MELRRTCGQPSLRDLERQASLAGQSLPRTTISDALTKDRLPPIGVVLRFVQACTGWARRQGLAVDAPDVIRWQDRWMRAAAEQPDDAEDDEEELDTDPHPMPPGRGMVWLPEVAGSQYLLVSNTTWPLGPTVSATTVAAGTERFTAAMQSAAPWLRMRVVRDQTRFTVEDAIHEAAVSTRDVLFLHLAGLGYLDRDLRPRFLTADTDGLHLEMSSLDVMGTLRDCIATSRARGIVAILDFSFAADALDQTQADRWRPLFMLAATHDQSAGAGRSLTAALAAALEEKAAPHGLPLWTMDSLLEQCVLASGWTSSKSRRGYRVVQQGNAGRIAVALRR